MPQLSTSDLLLRDPVTGVYARRAGASRLEAAIGEARSAKGSVSLLLIHISFPKNANPVPDRVRNSAVTSFVKRVEETAQTADRMFKLGGTDYGLILAGTSGDKATGVARKLLKALHAVPLEAGLPFTLSLSMGVASFPADAQGAESLIESAQHRMREARRRGHGRVVFQDTEEEKARSTKLLPALMPPAAEPEKEVVEGTESVVRLRCELPPLPSPLLYRDAELAQLVARLDYARLVTVVAPDGAGKTHLALAAAHKHAHKHRDGALMAAVGDASSLEQALGVIGEQLGFAFMPEEGFGEQLIGFLAHKEMLLLIDNYGHSVEWVRFLRDLLDGAPEVTVLLTSRGPTELRAEEVHLLSGLAIEPPNDGEESSEHEGRHWTGYLADEQKPEEGARRCGAAASFFVQMARKENPGFAPQAGEWEHIDTIGRLLDGSPLAIKIVTPWVRVHSCQSIAGELSRTLRRLAAAPRRADQEAKGPRAALRYAWSLLPELRRDGLSRLAVFRGGFSERAAVRVAEITQSQLLNLVDKSLVLTTPDERFCLHPTVRQFVEEKLNSNPGRSTETRQQHALYYLGALRDLEPRLLKGDSNAAVGILSELAAEIWNIRAAWDWAVERTMEDAIGNALESLCIFYETRGLFGEGEREFGRAAESLRRTKEGRGETLGRVLVRHARMSTRLGRFDQAGNLLQEALVYLTGIYAPEETARALRGLGEVAYLLGKYDEALEFVEEARNIGGEMDEMQSIWSTAPTLNYLDLGSGSQG
jgi:diguanylate cyclase (GGDEF)-like protein